MGFSEWSEKANEATLAKEAKKAIFIDEVKMVKTAQVVKIFKTFLFSQHRQVRSNRERPSQMPFVNFILISIKYFHDWIDMFLNFNTFAFYMLGNRLPWEQPKMKKILLLLFFIANYFACLNGQSLLQKADIAYQNRKYSEAIEVYREYITRSGKETYVVTIPLANCYYYTDDYANAQKFYAKTPVKDMTAKDWLNYGELLRKQGQYSDALKKYNRALYCPQKNVAESRIRLAIKACEKDQENNAAPADSSQLLNQLKMKKFIGTAEFSFNGKMVYYTKLVTVNGKTMYKLYSARLNNSTAEWERETLLSFCKSAYNYAQPALSLDNKTMYFSSDMPGSLGGMDIFKVVKNGSRWSEPVNMGSVINTDKNELYPYITPGGYLSFTSDGHSGYGGLDAYWVEEENGKPVGIKHAEMPINSSYDDFAALIDPDSDMPVVEEEKEEVVEREAVNEDLQQREVEELEEQLPVVVPEEDDSLLMAQHKAYEDSLQQVAYQDSLEQVAIAQAEADSIEQVRIEEEQEEALLVAKETAYNDSLRQVAVEDSLQQIAIAQEAAVEEETAEEEVLVEEDTVEVVEEELVAEAETEEGIVADAVVVEGAEDIVKESVEAEKIEPEAEKTETVIEDVSEEAVKKDVEGELEEWTERNYEELGVVNTFLVDALSSQLLKNATFVVIDNISKENVIEGSANQAGVIELDLKSAGVVEGRPVTITAKVDYGDFSSYSLELISNKIVAYDDTHPIMLIPVMAKRDKVKDNIVANKDVIGGNAFAYNGTELTDEGKKYLDAWVDFLIMNSNVKIKLMTHTDSRGEVSYNFNLSQKRAYAAKRYLIEQGVNHIQVIARGYGERYPLVKCKDCSEMEYDINRRIEVEVINAN